MKELNEALFLLINASAHPDAFLLTVAKLFAEYVIWLVPIALTIGWLRGNDRTRLILLEAAASGLAGLLINQIITLIWQHPRPFMIGLGHTYLAHTPDSSFPSDHLTLLWAVSFSFLMHRRPRMAGLALTLLGLPVAWARIYLGVHFPLDMVGAALVAVLSAWLLFREERWLVEPLYKLVIRIQRLLFALLNMQGWMQE